MDDIICPYCRTNHGCGLGPFLSEDRECAEEDFYCYDCGKTFHVRAERKVIYDITCIERVLQE